MVYAQPYRGPMRLCCEFTQSQRDNPKYCATCGNVVTGKKGGLRGTHKKADPDDMKVLMTKENNRLLLDNEKDLLIGMFVFGLLVLGTWCALSMLS